MNGGERQKTEDRRLKTAGEFTAKNAKRSTGSGGWKKHKLGNVIAEGKGVIHTGPFGSQLHASDYVQEGIPCIMPANMKDNRVDMNDIAFIGREDAQRLSKYLVQAGDIVYSRRGDVTQKALIRGKEAGYFCGTGCLLIRPGDKLDPDFLTYFLSTRTIQDWIVSQSIGGTMPNLNTGILKSLPVSYPDKSEQMKIADVLSALDAKIELNNRINAELEAVAKTLYDYWFVQFDFPFDFAKGQPAPNGQPYKSSGGKMLYNPTLKRPIPEGWSVSTIGEIFKTTLGGTPARNQASYWNPPEVCWLNSEDKGTLFVVKPDQHISREGLKNSAAKLLSAGTVILSIVRHLRASILAIDAATNQSVVGIEETPDIKSSYMYPLILREIPRYMMQRTGAQQPHINKEAVDETSIILPDNATQLHYQNIANPIFNSIRTNSLQTQQLTELRDWLLPMLMNGQVQVE